MSLTKEQLTAMNERIEVIEYVSRNLGDIKKEVILRQTKEIKKQIESAISQLK